MSLSPSHIKPRSIKAWLLATRPKTLLAGTIPVLVGSLMPAIPLNAIDWLVVGSVLAFSISITIAVNFINDALDFKRGGDTKDRIGPMRATQSGLLSSNQVLAAGFVLLLLAFVFALPLILKGGSSIFIIIIASAICSYCLIYGFMELVLEGCLLILM